MRDIKEMAREVKLPYDYVTGEPLYLEKLEAFAELVRADALAEQPAQPLPFGVGGGLVAIKTLLSRDPCVHANTAIQMIDSILAEQPAHAPVEWMEMVVANLVREGVNKHKARELAQHFYTSPPAQRPWVGLTDEEQTEIMSEAREFVSRGLLDLVEAKLKEKNNG